MLDVLRGDLVLRGLALVIAFALWVSITGEDRAVKDVNLPLEVVLQDDLILAEPAPTTITVRLGGPRTLIRKLEPVGLAVHLELDEEEPGERELQLTEEHLTGLPDRISVTFFDPQRVRLVVDRRIRRTLPVEPTLLGEPPDGYQLYITHVRPERVLVEGPESSLAGVESLRTDPIRLEDRTGSFTLEVSAIPDAPQIRVIDPGPLLARVVIDQAPIEMTFDEVPVLSSDSFVGHAINPATLRVVLSGPAGVLEHITAAQIRAIADVSALEPGARAQRVEVDTGVVDLPEEHRWRVGVKSVQPRAVSVRLSAEDLPG